MIQNTLYAAILKENPENQKILSFGIVKLKIKLITNLYLLGNNNYDDNKHERPAQSNVTK